MSADDALFHAAEALGPELFAVVDGGKFDDVGQALASVGLSGQPLYLEGADPGVRAAAGHLVTLADRRDLRAVIEIARPREALVIWSWPSGSMALYRHLRTLNLVEIPNEARAEAEAAGEDVSAMPEYEPVLFRHWDPNVLAELLPLLEPSQRARFLGAATGLALDTADVGGAKASFKPANPVSFAEPGILRIRPEQADLLAQARQEALYREIAADLRKATPMEVFSGSHADLQAFVRQQHPRATSNGLHDSHSLAMFCMVHLLVPTDRWPMLQIEQYLSDADYAADPSARMQRYYDDFSDALERMAST